LKIERGVTAFPELQTEIESVLDENEMVSLDFARTMQEEVVRPPLVTPASGVGFGDELSRLGEESLFGNRPPADVAEEVLSLLTGMQRAPCPSGSGPGPAGPVRGGGAPTLGT